MSCGGLRPRFLQARDFSSHYPQNQHYKEPKIFVKEENQIFFRITCLRLRSPFDLASPFPAQSRRRKRGLSYLL